MEQEKDQKQEVPASEDSLFSDFKPAADDFKFVQEGTVIHEQRFSNKPTSFFKDALRRFVKNKSSVFGFIVIGILTLMAIIVPIADTNDITTPDVNIPFLTPRWAGFENAGFLDGGKDLKGIISNPANDYMPVGYHYQSDDPSDDEIMKIYRRYEQPLSNPSIYGQGGWVRVAPQVTGGSGYYVSPMATFTADGDYTVTVTVLSQPSIDYYPGNFEVTLQGVTDTVTLIAKNKDYLTANDETGTKHIYTIDDATIKAALAASFPDYPATPAVANLSFGIAGDVSDPTTQRTGIEVTAVAFANAADAADPISAFGWDEGNEVMIRTGATAWSVNGDAALTGAKATYVDFRQDTYYAPFGEHTGQISQNYLNSIIAKRWVSYTFGDPSSFQIIDDRSPIRSITDDKIVGSGLHEMTGSISYYRYKGYSEIPYYIFGTNQNGVDYFKLVFTGMRTSLILGISVTIICVLIGIIWGSISAYFGGWTDIVMERFTDVLVGIPWIVIMTLTILLLGNNFFVFLLALCLTGWIGVAASMRSQVYRYKRREYVLSSRTLGANDLRLIFRHIVPNAIGPIITSSVLMIPSVILSEASISYLGLGLRGLVSLGVSISEVQVYLQTSPYLTISSSLLIALLMICFNLFGNGLRDAFNPSLKGSESEM